MMRLRPCEDPRSCGMSNCSRPSTRAPRAAAWYAAALPIPPTPTTMTSYMTRADCTPPFVLRYAHEAHRTPGTRRRRGRRRRTARAGDGRENRAAAFPSHPPELDRPESRRRVLPEAVRVVGGGDDVERLRGGK